MSFKLTKSILPEENLLLQKARLVVVIIVRRGFFKKFEGELSLFVNGFLENPMRAKIAANKCPGWAFCLSWPI